MKIFNYNTEALVEATLIDFLDVYLIKGERFIMHKDFMYPHKCQFRIDDSANCPLYTIITDWKDADVIETYINSFCKGD
jgi:hypothetical protein